MNEESVLKKIAIIGASGFVGTHFYELIHGSGRDEAIPVIHSSGSAWRLIRGGAPLVSANLLSKEEIAKAIKGCTHVVNCSRGDDQVMLKGLENLLEVCADSKIQGLVHLSSVMVYGDPPSANSITEEGTSQPHLSEYGMLKFKQDEIVAKAAKNVPSVILCPPNITGPYSPYLTGLVNAIQNEEFALMGDGSAPCVVVDVDNLCHAIYQALDYCSSSPQRLFITDDELSTWSMIIEPLMELAGVSELNSITEAELRVLRDNLNRPVKSSFFQSLKHLVSSDVRKAIRKDPMLAKIDIMARKSVSLVGYRVEDKLRSSIAGHPPVPKLPQDTPLNVGLTAQQLRGVRHTCEKAKNTIGYVPTRSFKQSMDAFSRWYRRHNGLDSDYWPLLKMLWNV